MLRLTLSIEIDRVKARDPLSGEVSTLESTTTLLKKPPSIGLGEDGMLGLTLKSGFARFDRKRFRLKNISSISLHSVQTRSFDIQPEWQYIYRVSLTTSVAQRVMYTRVFVECYYFFLPVLMHCIRPYLLSPSYYSGGA